MVNQLKGVYCMLPKQASPVLAPNPVIDTAKSFVTHSIDVNAMQAMNMAAIGLIERLQEMKGLVALDAYSLASLAMDTRISRPEAGASSLHCLLPKSLGANG